MLIKSPLGFWKCYTYFLIIVLELGRAIPNFQMRKLRPREIGWLV